MSRQRVVGRGLGWGTAAGAICGALVPGLTGVIDAAAGDIPFEAALVLGFVLAPFGLIFGAMFGAVAGVLAAVTWLPMQGLPRPDVTARVVAGLIGPVTVVAISCWWWAPLEGIDAVLFMWLPALGACIFGFAFGHYLARPQQPQLPM